MLKRLFQKGKTASTLRRMGGLMVRGFAAAQTDRLLAGWRYDGGFTANEIIQHLTAIRGRSRQMAKDSPHYKRWLDLVAVNVVGEGFRFKSTPRDGSPLEGMRLDQGAARLIEYHWNRFCTQRDPLDQMTFCDSTGRKTMHEMDRLCAKTWARDGEYFIRRLVTDDNPYGITFQILRPDLCDHTYNVSSTGRGTIVHCGVELDEITRRPVAYYFHGKPKNPQNTWYNHGMPLVRIPASEILHGFMQEDEDQPRGVPWGHASLRKLKMLDEYDTAELTAARDEACSVRTYYTDSRDAGDELIDLTDPDNADAASALTAEKEPGQSEILPPMWRSETNTPQHPNREITNFKNSMLRDVSSGLNVEYANFTNDWAGVNYGSVRAGTISERDFYKVVQNTYISQNKSPMFYMWLDMFLRLSISGNLPIEKYDKFIDHEFRGRRWQWVDPLKDMAAAKIAVQEGWKTNTKVASEIGEDFDANVEEIKRETDSVLGTVLEKKNEQASRGADLVRAIIEMEKEYEHKENKES